MADAGWVAEVYRSVQGEGPFVGVLQAFLRTSGCSRSCIYCDTAYARERVPECTFKGPGTEKRAENPVGIDKLVFHIRSLAEVSPGIHSLSVTGGEPLEQPDFLVEFLRRARPLDLPLYLETNGLEEGAAREIAPLVDIVSLDIKLPSLCGGGDFFDTYERTLPLFGERNLFCKVVLAEGFDQQELAEAARLVARFDKRLPFVLQPARATGSCRRVQPDKLLQCYFTAAGHLENVRLIPQCHHQLGLP